MTTEMVIDTLRVGNADGGHIEVTLRGEPTAVMQALVDGLSRETLAQLGGALSAELAKRHDEASGVTK